MSFEDERKVMIQQQLKERGIKSYNVLKSFERVRRELFILPGYEDYAYADSPLPIGNNQTISQPYIVALMLEKLKLDQNDVVLEIGAGSGYACALIAQRAKQVIGYEIIPGLAQQAQKNLQVAGISNVTIIRGNGCNILERETFNKILCSAGTDKLPDNLCDLLKKNGILVIPEGEEEQRIRVYKKKEYKLMLIEESAAVAFVPLIKKD